MRRPGPPGRALLGARGRTGPRRAGGGPGAPRGPAVAVGSLLAVDSRRGRASAVQSQGTWRSRPGHFPCSRLRDGPVGLQRERLRAAPAAGPAPWLRCVQRIKPGRVGRD